jgi:small subunit ribosomal protein S8
MAKLSSVNKNERRKKLVKQYAPKWAKLKAIANDESLDETERLIARLKMAELPRNSNPTRIRNRCEITGRPRAYYRKFRLARVMLRDLANKGLIPGLTKSIMAVTDPLGDLLTRIRNGQRAKKDSVLSPASKLRIRVLDVLQREGYIRGYSEEEMGPAKGVRIELKYFEGQPAIKHVARVSKPGRRIYSGSSELPRVMNGLGITIVSTPKGVLSDAEAREQNVGGEVLAEVF